MNSWKSRNLALCGALIALLSSPGSFAMGSKPKPRKTSTPKKLIRKQKVRYRTQDSLSRSRSQALSVSMETGSWMRIFAGTSVRPLVGWNMMNPAELNGFLNRAFGGKNDFEIGNGSSFGIAVDYPVLVDGLYAGLRLERLNATSKKAAVAEGSRTQGQTSLSGMPVMLTGTYLHPVARNLRAGAMLGFGMAMGYHTSVEITDSDSDRMPNGTLTYGGAPFTGLVAATAGYELSPNVGIRIETGYRILSSINMKVSHGYGDFKEGETFKSEDGKNLRVNASAFYSGLSVAVTL